MPKSRKRAKHSKVKTGCLTCKGRHVRCDERRPSCLKCAQGGYLCEGYAKGTWMIKYTPAEEHAAESTSSQNGNVALKLHFLPVKTQHDSPLPFGETPLLLLSPSNPYQTIEELRAFKFYSERSAPILCRFSNNDPALWTSVIPQLAWSNVAVRHSLAATGLVFETMGTAFSQDAESRRASPSGQQSPTTTAPQTRLSSARVHINKVIRSLILDNPPIEIVLTAGFLLRFLETLGHDAAVARMHLIHTIKVLQVYKRNAARGATIGFTHSQHDLIATYLEPAIRHATRHAKRTLTHPDGIARPLIDDPTSLVGAEIRREVMGEDR